MLHLYLREFITWHVLIQTEYKKIRVEKFYSVIDFYYLKCDQIKCIYK